MILRDKYKQWCKETHRGGAVLVGGSINEFLDWLEKPYDRTANKDELEVFVKIPIETPPLVSGKYIVCTRSRFRTNAFEAYYNGNSFDVNNQEVTHWLKKEII